MKYDPQKISGYFFRIIGALCVGWGILCLLGGPDGKIGSIESLKWGGGFMVSGFILIGVGRLIYENIK
jgi:hypothetical protein